ncbi:hypothetical protein ElyMa_004063900 [Elysia marginata]|uniref:Uncharacterized protein n=1 Tax=Elysia marginata TaxID=1093978 RepID=A0AAV4G7M2_9GAST|nr:hypothetical protein ElyMa_004063900 [Elysia marginata]
MCGEKITWSDFALYQSYHHFIVALPSRDVSVSVSRGVASGRGVKPPTGSVSRFNSGPLARRGYGGELERLRSDEGVRNRTGGWETSCAGDGKQNL